MIIGLVQCSTLFCFDDVAGVHSILERGEKSYPIFVAGSPKKQGVLLESSSMDTTSTSYSAILYLVVFAILVFFLIRFLLNTPSYPRVEEGFYGGVARGSGHPDCLRTLPEGSEILDVLAHPIANAPAVSEGSADYREFQLILSKLGCLKKDLMSPSGIVEATRYQAFETAHDRINVAEVCAMCLNQTIPSRDLNLVFIGWRDRGRVLLRKLCTEANLKEEEVVKLEKLFMKAFNDVYDIATSRCLKTDFSLQHGGATGGDVSPYMPENLKDARSYDGIREASGWNGSI